jgi:hypothetical protein
VYASTKEDDMTRKTMPFDAVSIMQIVVAVFLLTLGLIGLMGWSSGAAQFGRDLTRLFGGANSPFNLIVAILELAAGVIVFAALFVTMRSRILNILTFIIAILWVVEILISFFAYDVFQPDFVIWLNRLAAETIILLALWLINRRYAA